MKHYLKKLHSNRTLLLLGIFLFSCTMHIVAQKKMIQGTVTNLSDKTPLLGASVLIKDSNSGVFTDFDGNYSIKASIGDILIFNYVGMISKNVKITSTKINVALLPSVEDLDEVVVIGYGSVKKKEITGAVSQVKAESIEGFVNQDIASSLQGQVSGVNITAPSGEPGESASIQIRGITSLSGNNTPLFVVDGIPQEGDPRLSPNEIETIDILKDAASTAVYGTRGAAGVILITTKQGKEGAMSISLNASNSFQYLGDVVPLMNAQERISYELTKYNLGTPDIGIPGPLRNPDWLNNDNRFDDLILINGAQTQQYTLNVSGGTKDFSYNLVGGYYDQEGALINSGFKRYNGRISTTYKTDNWQINGSLAVTTEVNNRVSTGLVVSAIRYPAYYPKVNPNDDVVYTDQLGRSNVNNFAQALSRTNTTDTDRINTSLNITRKITNALDITTRIGGTILNQNQNQFSPQYTEVDIDDDVSSKDPTRSSVTASNTRRTNYTAEAILNYTKKIGDHNIRLLATSSINQTDQKQFTAYKQGIINNNVDVLNGASINPDAYSGFNYTSKIVGLLGRVQYNYKGKYLLSALIRRDGSSKFSQNYRWGIFPSTSFAWNISDEDFWQDAKKTINNFRLRISSGTVGNESFNPYEYTSNIAFGSDYIFDGNDNSPSYGTAIRSYANANVKWETSIQQNIGIDVGFLKNKIIFTADYYNTQKKDMLFPVRLPGSTGAYYDPTITLNVGNMTNSGLELATKYRERIGKSRLDVNATFTTNKNKITKMSGDTNIIYNSNSSLINGDPQAITTAIAKGYEAGSYFLMETNGIIKTQEQLDEYKQFPSRSDAQLGDLVYVDYNKDGDITDEDRHYMGSGLPEFEFGFNLKWTYQNFDLAMNWYGTVGSEILNGTKAAAYAVGNHKGLIDMWTPQNQNTNIPLNNGDNKSGSYNYRGNTDYWLENGDYLRLKLVTLGYNLPKKVNQQLGITNARFYVSAQNALTFTNYSGYNPEVGGNVATRGLDRARYPLTALYTVGLNLKF
ncbi:TonB-linked SusC/RagA family outer membrane protein [Wenyingzhuangia heitensis]|uniref:TonB-linked SusC/RagA family outer membrane protein n=2 Tax=Pseudomonadati TaxID=3379134 RepID=A0ABX0U7G0_9FLAO|nr:TonB-dependent receptor [Wenyingzhuangia heitensis]NIJ44274.1 TonB-linked SusC/RagA family outer membrane protein [Wenyingzhuangia heitensis]